MSIARRWDWASPKLTDLLNWQPSINSFNPDFRVACDEPDKEEPTDLLAS